MFLLTCLFNRNVGTLYNSAKSRSIIAFLLINQRYEPQGKPWTRLAAASCRGIKPTWNKTGGNGEIILGGGNGYFSTTIAADVKFLFIENLDKKLITSPNLLFIRHNKILGIDINFENIYRPEWNQKPFYRTPPVTLGDSGLVLSG